MIAAKITSMAIAFGVVKEDAENAFDHYHYISSNKVLALVRELLPKHKLSIIPQIIKHEERDLSSSAGKAVIRTVVDMEFLITDIEDNEKMTLKFSGADQDTKGKSFGQAVTECVKRFYLKLFNISSADEIDPDSKSTENQLMKPAETKTVDPASAIWAGMVKECQDIKDLATLKSFWDAKKPIAAKYRLTTNFNKMITLRKAIINAGGKNA